MTPEFNRLSRADRAKLYFAAAVAWMPSLARRDVVKHPWRYPFYGLFIGIHVIPFIFLPIPFLKTATLIPPLAWAWMGIGSWGRMAKGHLKADFNKAALVERYKDCITIADPAQPNVHSVQSVALTKKVGIMMWNDSAEATREFGQASKRAVAKIRDFFKPPWP